VTTALVVESTEEKVRFWRRPFFKPVLGLVLVFVVLVADEVYGCVGGAGCSTGVFSIVGVVVLAVGLVIWSRLDAESNRFWAILIAGLGLVLALAGVTTGPTIQTIPAFGTSKISPDIDRSAERVDVIVDLKFEPDQFHRETIAELGVFSGTDREDRSKLRMRAVPQENLPKIANLFWVEEIVPFVR
jgi:hypothetical protein